MWITVPAAEIFATICHESFLLVISSSSAHPGRRKMRADVGAALRAGIADEPVLDVRKPDIIGPLARAHFDRVAAFVVGTVDQDAPYPAIAHLSEGDLCGRVRAGMAHDSANRS
jgi:hypothetical protein